MNNYPLGGVHEDYLADTKIHAHWKYADKGVEVTAILTDEAQPRLIRLHDEGYAKETFARRITDNLTIPQERVPT